MARGQINYVLIQGEAMAAVEWEDLFCWREEVLFMIAVHPSHPCFGKDFFRVK